MSDKIVEKTSWGNFAGQKVVMAQFISREASPPPPPPPPRK
jgi:hypothetical protein